MMKLTIKLTTIASVAIFLLWGNVLQKQSKNEQSTAAFVLSGNSTIDADLIFNEGMISPGHSPGKITVTGDFTMGSNATYKCELKDLTGGGSGHDQIDVSGNANLNGTLEITLLGYTPNSTDQFEIIKYGGTLSGTFGNITGMPAGWQIDYGVLLPGKVTLYGSGSAIPIELLSFKAIKERKEILLSWQTASEQNSDYFAVERSTDGKKFTGIGRVNASGTSMETHNYSLTDKNPATGLNYYRLKQVDKDGHFTLSKIISMVFDSNVLSFYPNPATKTLFFNKAIEVVSIRDMQGKQVLHLKDVTSDIDISTLRPGTYIVDVNHGAYKGRLVVE